MPPGLRVPRFVIQWSGRSFRFISLDDNEIGPLRVLMDEVFGSDFVVQIRERNGADAKPCPRVCVIESKGRQLRGNTDTEYKRENEIPCYGDGSQQCRHLFG